MEYLDIVDAHGRHQRLRLDKPRLLIGREPHCDVYLPHPHVSRRHAQLQRTGQGRWMLQDLNSLNHVYVDDVPVQQIILEPGKRVRIGEFWLELQQTAAALSAAPKTHPPGTAGQWEVVDTPLETRPALEPGWLEQLQLFDYQVLRLAEPRMVLERLAREFERVVRPQVVAVGLGAGEHYTWETVLKVEAKSSPQPQITEADRRVLEDDSSIQVWKLVPGEPAPGGGPPTLCLLFPMRGRTGIVGHVYVQGPNPYPLPAPIQGYLSLLVTHASLVWENLQLAALRVAQEQLVSELRQARQIQVELFPPTFDLDPRLDVFAVNLPSVWVSGDYYDVIRTGPDTFAFVVADAMGHGMPAALLMAAVRASLRMAVSLGLSWHDLFKGIDEIVSQARSSPFVTGIVGHLDVYTGELSLAIAGHPPPSIVVDGRPAVIPDHCRTRPWGLDIDSPWAVGRLSLAGSAWSVLCYTDGITDAAVRAQRTLGQQRVTAFHLERWRDSAEDLCHGLYSEVAAQPGKTSLGDDQTVLVMRSARKATPTSV
jgi:sigma-B regulation protein RsbU (phosphoserine phosphatase)